MNYFKFLSCSKAIQAFFIVFCLSIFNASGQADSSFDNGILTPGGLLDTAIDRTGHRYHLLSIAVNDTLRAGGDSLTVNKISSCSSGYFQLYFEPGSGMEDDGNPAHLARRNVLCHLLSDISSFVHSPLSANGNKINMWIRDKAQVPGALGLGYATSFFNVAATTNLGGIADNSAWLTINSGNDAYRGTIPPTQLSSSTAGTCFHIIATFDFDSYAWHTDLSTPPSISEYDLYTVGLREMTHALGLASEIDVNGLSMLGVDYNYYARYDKFLQTHSGISVLSHSGSSMMSGYGFNSALIAVDVLSPHWLTCVTDSTDCDTAVRFVGSVNVPVYTPNCFEHGFSLSSFEDMCGYGGNDQYFTASNATAAGSQKRYLKTEERLALQDIGYSVDTAFGDTSALNNYTYAGGIHAGMTTVGLNDLYTGDGVLRYFTSRLNNDVQVNGSGIPSGVAGILGNDSYATGFEDLQVVVGSGTLSDTVGNDSTAVSYMPSGADQGMIMLRYVPVNAVTGQRGNYTYVGLLVTHFVACPAEACNLVENGNFNIGTGCGQANQYHPPICNWLSVSNTPDYYVNGCTSIQNYVGYSYHVTFSSPLSASENGGYSVDDATVPNGSFMGLYTRVHPATGTSVAAYESEAIQTQLTAPLIRGGHYTLEFDARVAVDIANVNTTGPYWTYHDVSLQFYVNPGATAGFPGMSSAWTMATLPANPLVNNAPYIANGFPVTADVLPGNVWHHYTYNFTYSATSPLGTAALPQWLMVQNAGHLTANHLGLATSFRDYVFVDNVKITPVMASAPVNMCIGATAALNNSVLVMDPGWTAPASTYVWSPATGLSCVACPNPTVTFPTAGTHVYSVVDNFYQCTTQETVTVFNPPPAPAITGTLAFCAGGSTVLTSTSLTGNQWYFGGIAIPGATGHTYAASAPGTYFVIVVDAVSGCVSPPSASVVVVMNPLPPTPAISGILSFCPGNSTVLTSTALTGNQWYLGGVAIPGANGHTYTASVPGTYTVIVTNPVTYCASLPSLPVTVTLNPAPPVPVISGALSFCAGSFTILTSSAPTGNQWFVGLSAIAGATGTTYAVTSAGVYSVRVTNGFGCATNSASVTVITNPLPTVSGTLSVCLGATTNLTPATGTWAETDPDISVGSTSGIVTGVAAGVGVVTYTSPSTGCSTSVTVTVHPLPSVAGTSVCEGGGTGTLLPVTATWAESDAHFDVTSGGLVTGISAGTGIATYTSAMTGCVNYASITVNAIPEAPVVTAGGPTTFCAGSSVLLTSTASSGNQWYRDGSPIAGATGTTYSATISGVYTVTVSAPPHYCASAMSNSITVIVSPLPVIGGILSVCLGGSTNLTPAAGIWSGTDPDVSVGASSGIVTGNAVGTGLVTYTSPSTGCSASASITVNENPSISGTTHFCFGTGTILTGSPASGTWTSGSASVAVVDAAGNVTSGSAAGTANISYTIAATGCFATVPVTVYALPATPVITALSSTTFCAGGSVVLSSSATTDNQWYVGGVLIAGATAQTYATGIAGVYTVIVSNPDCPSLPSAPVTIVVNPNPTLTTVNVCIGQSQFVPFSPAGGTLSTVSTMFSIIPPDQIYGITSGADMLTYTLPTGCSASAIMYVRTLPTPAITALGSTTFCAGGSVVLRSSFGFTYQWSDAAGIIPGANTQYYTVTTPGTYYVTISNVFGCYGTSTGRTVTVNPLPVVDAGPDITVCNDRTKSQLGVTVDFVLNPTVGYTYLWSPGTGLSSVTDPNPYANPPVTTTYAVTVTNTTTGCSNTDYMTIFVNPPEKEGECGPCSVFGDVPFTTLSGTVSTDLPPGNYFASSDLTIAGGVEFRSAIVLMAQDKTIYVKPNSMLSTFSSHLFTCKNTMWNGIVLTHDATETGVIRLEVSKGPATLIEDARAGISVTGPLPPPNALSDRYIYCAHGLFNRNWVGIHIADHTPATSTLAATPNTYEFRIENAVFTSRDFTGFVGIGGSYMVGTFPYMWPDNIGTYGLKKLWNPTTALPDPVNGPYMAPYNIINPHAGSGGMPYPAVSCHDGSDPFAGIQLENVGNTSGPYTSVVIGSNIIGNATDVRPMVLFDTLNYGIYAFNSNLTVNNSAFISSRPFTIDRDPFLIGVGGGAGIYTEMDNGRRYQLSVTPIAATYLATDGPHTITLQNYFYNCRQGVYSKNYYQIAGDGTYMTTTQRINDGTNNYGYYLVSKVYNEIKVVNNTIINVTNGIVLKNMGSTAPFTAFEHVDISRNRILGRLNSDTYGIRYTDKSIWIENLINYFMPPTFTGQVNVDNNFMKNVYNGIFINNVGFQIATSNSDTVNGLKYPAGYSPSTLLTSLSQYGIWHQKCKLNRIISSRVIGDNYAGNDNWYGIWIKGGTKPTIKCNYTNNVGRGFEFDAISSVGTIWRNNTMEYCGKGFVLNASILGPQGSNSPALASNNIWRPNSTFWNVTTNPQTLVIGGAYAANSKLWVSSGGFTSPSQNAPLGSPVRYFSPTGIGVFTSTFSIDASCATSGGGSSGTSVREIAFFNKVAAAKKGYIGYRSQHGWNSQYELWQEMLADDSLATASDTLAAFYAMAGNSRYAFFTDIEKSIAADDMATAQSLLDSVGIDDPANPGYDSATGAKMWDIVSPDIDAIVQNYRDYYQLYITYKTDTLTDSTALARLAAIANDCPITGGAIVYKAQALYRLVYDDLQVFNAECPDSTETGEDSTGEKSNYPDVIGAENGGQRYELLPNPNNGQFVIHQQTVDEDAVTAEVYDMTGRLLLKQRLLFANKENTLAANSVPGVYILKLHDSKGRIFTFKYVVQ